MEAQADKRRGRPPVGDFAGTGPRGIAAGRRSLGGARDVGLSENSISVQVPVSGRDKDTLQTIAVRSKGRKEKEPVAAEEYKSVNVVLDDVKVLAAGKAGGYFYQVYLNLPDAGATGTAGGNHLLGTVGPFEIESASHHAQHGGSAKLVFPATEALAELPVEQYKGLTVSLVRVSGKNSPKGRAISVGEVRVEVSTEEPYDVAPQVPPPPGTPYNLR